MKIKKQNKISNLIEYEKMTSNSGLQLVVILRSKASLLSHM